MADPENKTARRALSIAAALASTTPGEKAEARRMDAAGSPLFWRQAARLELPQSQEAMWLRYTRMVALMTPAGRDGSIHDAGRPLGAALADAKLSEQRFARLLAARGTTRDDALERAIRMLARTGKGLNVTDLANAILWPDETSRLARTYYRQLDKQMPEELEND
ncbi:type I-E CRISPR-associated protein Cse2/CasB [Paracoccus litorisediminis]|uniref:type I-E CRISPR-associated protein Cse2/CasB n=1 Tax=Paracoccus litorisediminis TaxID=2006130 RepID=UPI0037325DD4